MGCDIHMYVEVRDDNPGDYVRIWHAVSGRNHLYESLKESYERHSDPIPMPPWLKPFTFENWIYYSRDYTLFAVLAGVRNDGDITPISTPRGLPDDVSFVVLSLTDEYAGDEHSHSYYTLQELLDFSWDEICDGSGNTYREIVPEFIDETLPRLQKVTQDRDPCDVRLVFWFDN